MFRMALEGKSYSQIASTLRNENILTPKAYLGNSEKRRSNGDKYVFNIKYPYAWGHTTALSILTNHIYTGKIVCMKLANKSFKNKSKVARPKEDWIITENAHEALVSQQDFDTVQERMKSKQRPYTLNKMNIFRGLVFCSDCNRRLSFNSTKNKGSFRCCVSVRCGKGLCTSHNISLENLKEIVLKDIQRHSALAAESEKKYAEYLLSISEGEKNGKRNSMQKEAEKCRRRLDEIDTLILKLYEDKVFEVISQERFAAMSAKLETEQSEVKARCEELTEYLSNRVAKSKNADSFAELISQYTNITELDEELTHTLIEKIVVHETEVVDGKKTKRVDIYYRFIGNINEHKMILQGGNKYAEVS